MRLKFYCVALNMSLSQWNRLNKSWHQQICYFVFLIVGCTHFSIINVFWLFCKCVSHLKSQFLLLSLHVIESRSFPVCVLSQSKCNVRPIVFSFFFSLFSQSWCNWGYVIPVTVPDLKRKQTWLSYKRFSCFVNEAMGHWALSPVAVIDRLYHGSKEIM